MQLLHLSPASPQGVAGGAVSFTKSLGRWVMVGVRDCRWVTVGVRDCRWVMVDVRDCTHALKVPVRPMSPTLLLPSLR